MKNKNNLTDGGLLIPTRGAWVTEQRGQLLNDTWSTLNDAHAGFVAMISRIDELAHNGKTIPYDQLNTRLKNWG